MLIKIASKYVDDINNSSDMVIKFLKNFIINKYIIKLV